MAQDAAERLVHTHSVVYHSYSHPLQVHQLTNPLGGGPPEPGFWVVMAGMAPNWQVL